MINRCYRSTLAAILLFCTAQANVHAADDTERSRGDLLYSTHCIACHTTHVHWRDQRLATDWPSLTKQVRRWQNNARLGWNEEDIEAVARYLNALYYHFPASEEEKTISLSSQEDTNAQQHAR